MIGLGNQGGGKDDISGYNTHSFVLQVPASDVTRDGKAVNGPKAAQQHRRRLVDHRAQGAQGQQEGRAGRALEAGQPRSATRWSTR